MKKLLSIALCAAAVSAFGETVTVLGQVGVTAITSSLQNTIVAVSYDDLAGGSGMVVSNLVKTTNLTAGDQLAIFNGGTGTGGIYDTWVLTANANGSLYWAKNAKTFTVDADGQLKEGEGNAASGITKAVGTGIWLCRKEKPTEAFTFYIYGKPVSDPVSDISADTWTLVGNPLQNTAVTKNTINVDGAQTGDQIVTVGENGKLLYFAYVKGKGWSGLPDIGPGIGFWIKTQADTKIIWP